MTKQIKLLISTVAFFTTISVFIYTILKVFRPEWLPANFWLIPFYYSISSVLLSWFVAKASTDKRFLSLQVLLGARLIVVVLGLMFLFVGLFFDRQHAIPLTIIYVVFYAFFSVIETRVLIGLTKKI